MIREVVRSPMTEPCFLISMRPLARRLPLTSPNTITSDAVISPLTWAFCPMVSRWSPSEMGPSTLHSTWRSSVPVIWPLIFSPGPSQAGARVPATCVRGVSSIFLLGGGVTGAVTGVGVGSSVLSPVPVDVAGGYDACLLVHMTPSWVQNGANGLGLGVISLGSPSRWKQGRNAAQVTIASLKRAL